MIIYKWAALAPDPDDVPVALGITDSFTRAVIAAGALVEAGLAMMAHVEGVKLVLDCSLQPHYMSSGLWWTGRRNRRGKTRWFMLGRIPLPPLPSDTAL